MITDQQFQDWLLGEYSQRVLLAEITYYDTVASQEKTLYLSNLEYVTDSQYTDQSYTGTPVNTGYTPSIVGGFDFSQSLQVLKGSFSFNWGSINVDNEEGLLDDWIFHGTGYHIFKNRKVTMYLGDSTWERPDFRQIFTGIIDDVGVYDSNTLTIRFKDRLQLFNQPVNIGSNGLVRTLGDLYKDRHAGAAMPTNNNRYQEIDKPLPVCFGDCFNITPLNVDWVYADDILTYNYYMVHDGPIEEVIAVRDNGIVLPATAYQVLYDEGIIQISSTAYGSITCDVRGAKIASAKQFTVSGGAATIDTIAGVNTYVSNLPNLLLNLLTNYGIIQNRLLDQDFDLPSIYDYLISTKVSDGTGNTGLAEVCYFGSSSDNIISIIKSLSESLSTELILTKDSLFSFLLVQMPESLTASATFGISDILDKGFKVTSIDSPEVNNIKLGYAKNFTIGTELAFMVAGPQKEILQREYNELIGTPITPVSSEYNLPTVTSNLEGTLLIEQVRAQEEATRRANRFCRRSINVTMETSPASWSINLGTCITLNYYRYNLTSVKALVVGRKQNITKGTYTLELLI